MSKQEIFFQKLVVTEMIDGKNHGGFEAIEEYPRLGDSQKISENVKK